METKRIKLYYHETYGGAEYLCSNNVENTDEGSFDSNYIVRIDGDITKDAELNIKDDICKELLDSALICIKMLDELLRDGDAWERGAIARLYDAIDKANK